MKFFLSFPFLLASLIIYSPSLEWQEFHSKCCQRESQFDQFAVPQKILMRAKNCAAVQSESDGGEAELSLWLQCHRVYELIGS